MTQRHLNENGNNKVVQRCKALAKQTTGTDELQQAADTRTKIMIELTQILSSQYVPYNKMYSTAFDPQIASLGSQERLKRPHTLQGKSNKDTKQTEMI